MTIRGVLSVPKKLDLNIYRKKCLVETVLKEKSKLEAINVLRISNYFISPNYFLLVFEYCQCGLTAVSCW